VLKQGGSFKPKVTRRRLSERAKGSRKAKPPKGRRQLLGEWRGKNSDFSPSVPMRRRQLLNKWGGNRGSPPGIKQAIPLCGSALWRTDAGEGKDGIYSGKLRKTGADPHQVLYFGSMFGSMTGCQLACEEMSALPLSKWAQDTVDEVLAALQWQAPYDFIHIRTGGGDGERIPLNLKKSVDYFEWRGMASDEAIKHLWIATDMGPETSAITQSSLCKGEHKCHGVYSKQIADVIRRRASAGRISHGALTMLLDVAMSKYARDLYFTSQLFFSNEMGKRSPKSKLRKGMTHEEMLTKGEKSIT